MGCYPFIVPLVDIQVWVMNLDYFASLVLREDLLLSRICE
jgi:hypothetical protein